MKKIMLSTIIAIAFLGATNASAQSQRVGNTPVRNVSAAAVSHAPAAAMASDKKENTPAPAVQQNVTPATNAKAAPAVKTMRTAPVPTQPGKAAKQ